MEVMYLALGVAALVVAGGIAAFVWAVRQGQYDDLDSPAYRMLHDDDD